jgi:putative ABC transport system permease protein
MWVMIIKSMLNRKGTILLTIFSIAISVTLLLGVERIKNEANNSFTNTISGIDLVVGARSGPVELLLYSVFHIGNATNNISWLSYQEIKKHPAVKWTIPISLGDSHKGYRVVGTKRNYFKYYKYSDQKPIKLVKGNIFKDMFDVVLGAEVAEKLGYKIGDKIVISHGTGDVSLIDHDDKPFVVVGILAKTSTPVDKTLYVSLAGIEAIHINWQNGRPMPGANISAQHIKKVKLVPKQITAFFVGLKTRLASFKVQSVINNYYQEPLLAVFPGVALQQIWDIVGVGEKALFIVSLFVLVAGFLSMLIALMTSINQRRREMAILRSVGASPYHVFSLVFIESAIITILGIVVGVIMLYVILACSQTFLTDNFGIYILLKFLSLRDFLIIFFVFVGGLLIGLIPATKIYRNSLIDGLTIKY